MQEATVHYKNSFKTIQRNTTLFVVSTGIQRCEPGYAWGPGIRDHYLIHLVTTGRGTMDVDGKTYQISPNELFLAYPGKTMRYRADQQDPWAYIWVGFDGQDAPLLLDLAGFSPDQPVLTSPCRDTEAKLMDLYQSRGDRVYEIIRMTGRLYEFFSYLIANTVPSRRLREDGSRQIVNKAIDYIHGNYQSPITIESIADHTEISRSSLYRSFRKHTGLSPLQHVLQCRIERACFLLQNTNHLIKDVARLAGFEDPLYFSRAFRQAKGQSPKQYRKMTSVH